MIFEEPPSCGRTELFFRQVRTQDSLTPPPLYTPTFKEYSYEFHAYSRFKNSYGNHKQVSP